MSTQPTTDSTTEPSSSLADLTLASYLNALNSKTPTPGGGAVAGTSGATGAAIAGMVIHYSLEKKKYADHDSDNQAHLESLTTAQQAFIALADDDARGYGELNSLWSLPETDPKRQARWDAAVLGAITPPTKMLELCVEIINIVESLIGTTNTQLRSDLAVAAITLRGAAHSAACNIRINVPLLKNEQQGPALDKTTEQLNTIDKLCERIVSLCQ